MLNKLLVQIRKYHMVEPGDRVICAVSGGADSVALLWSMYLLKEKLGILLEAAHYNHGLRGEESDRDEAFVKNFCRDYGIVCHVGGGAVKPGKKGLEAAARDARYAFLKSLPGKIATAHTADDNAETVLMHLVRGTGLKGLGGIMPVNGNVIRPMLGISREEVLSFLREYHLPFVEDSSNGADDFLRNRLRHHVMPYLKDENPRLAENVSIMAMELRQDEETLRSAVPSDLRVPLLREMKPALRRRALAAFLQESGVKEPERAHIGLAESLVFSDNPSAWADFPGNVRIRRCYDTLQKAEKGSSFAARMLGTEDRVALSELSLCVTSCATGDGANDVNCFTVSPVGQMVLRSRLPGDKLRLSGGTKTLKKLFIDRKIPEHTRGLLVVVADDLGVLGVQGIGPNLDRLSDSGVRITFETIE